MHNTIWYAQVLGHARQCPSLLERKGVHIDIHLIIRHLVFDGSLRVTNFSAQRSIYHRKELGSLSGIRHVALGLNAAQQALIEVVLEGILECFCAGPSPQLRMPGLHFFFKCLCITTYKTIHVTMRTSIHRNMSTSTQHSGPITHLKGHACSVFLSTELASRYTTEGSARDCLSQP